MKRLLPLVLSAILAFSLIPVASSPVLAVNGTGRLFMVNGAWDEGEGPASEILELDPDTGTVLRTVPTPIDTDGGGDGLAYGNGRMFFTTIDTNTIYEIDPSDGSVINSFMGPGTSYGIDALGFDGQKLYALEYGEEPAIHVLDPDTGASVTTLSPTVVLIGGGTFAGTRNSLFFTGDDESGFSVIFEICATTGAVMNSFAPPAGLFSLYGLGFSSSRNTLFLGAYEHNMIYELDPDDGTIINSFSGPEGAAISALAADEPRPTHTVVPSMAAPNIAEIILEAEGVDPQQSIGKGKNRTFINLIQLTAAHMGSQTDFDGVSKYLLVGEPGEEVETLNPAYWQAVLDFLNGQIAFYGLSIGPLSYSYADYVADQNGGTEPGIIFAEDFTSVLTGEIPAGWSQTAAYPNWSVYTASNYAGGTIPEMTFRWSPSFVGTSRLITPAIDAGAYSNLELTFRQMVDNFDSYNWPYILKVQVSLDGGTSWVDAWSVAPWGMISAETVTVDLSTYAGQSVKLAWVFSGDSYGINYWYIDDILVTGS
jgi:hypothetical protein